MYEHYTSIKSGKVFTLEGLSCSGKSTLLNAVASEDNVPIFKQWVPTPSYSTEYFLDRDEDKYSRARQCVLEGKRVFIDRGYLSTLTFYHVLQEQHGIPVYPVLEWFINNVGEAIYRPDANIFVEVPPDVSLERARCARKIDENNMWLHYPERILHWYERLYTVFEFGVPKYTLDGTLPPEQLVAQFNDLLAKLERDEHDSKQE